jgi:hypothetical protein
VTKRLQFSTKFSVVPRTLTAYIARKKLERELFATRQRWSHLVELYDGGLRRRLYNEEAFAKAVRRTRLTVNHPTDALHKYDRS